MRPLRRRTLSESSDAMRPAKRRRPPNVIMSALFGRGWQQSLDRREAPPARRIGYAAPGRCLPALLLCLSSPFILKSLNRCTAKAAPSKLLLKATIHACFLSASPPQQKNSAPRTGARLSLCLNQLNYSAFIASIIPNSDCQYTLYTALYASASNSSPAMPPDTVSRMPLNWFTNTA